MKYKDSGVDIDAASRALARAKEAIRSTWGEDVASEVGAFGGLYRLPGDGGYLVSSIDGVGTKLKVALAAGAVGSVGSDLVNHSVNDILVQGARPWFFLDYYAAGKLDQEGFVSVVEGMAQACRENSCALIGGETAEMPGIYSNDDFDLAGCIIGHVTEDRRLGPERVREGMDLWAWTSSGLHTNGFSLARRVLTEGDNALDLHQDPGDLGCTLAEALLAVHRSYLGQVNDFWPHADLAALCHITGGGFTDNIPRILPEGLAAEIDASAWEVLPIFRLIASRGPVDVDEMRRVFNLGIGMIAFAADVDESALAGLAEPPVRIGKVVARAGGETVRFLNEHRGL
ncbi:phosphoribosylformylglycinamidine cyclo-ligase [bacterium]|nr:MAG: phosphoribosylformylglycinamidine cyclo-ligase [bacterium]RKZ18512.1 MAG: phosphoribosylformylglycinamidine cyclo-ligase [bacterium]